MRNDSRDQAGVTLDDEVKAPIPVNARLPKIEGLAVLFRAQRRVRQILGQQANLFIEGSLDLGWGV